MKHELLSPVGNMESLYQAIHNGADAVYLGLKNFGARHYAKNFDEEEIVEAIKLCHLYGVKIYVTMNTLVKEEEVDQFLKQVLFLHKEGVDAIIMQDFGMISLVREMYPNLEIHASTQANNSSIETIEMFYQMGVKRVVLSRELSLDEIQKITVPIELEVFIHGALCISYSGNCLMSSMIGNRSANRGECTGCCRLPYRLLDNGKIISKEKYLLSTKELNSSSNFSKLLDSNISSFKIEGRMKSPEYVGFITRFYRKILDGKTIHLEEEQNKLKTLYNRDFTEGNLFRTQDLINQENPNHIGLRIGKVVGITKNKIKIKLERELNQEDGIRFFESGKGFICNYLYNHQDKLISSSGDFVYIDNKVDLKTYDTVYKTLDKRLIDELRNYNLKKIPIQICVIGKLNQKLKVIFSDSENTVEEEGAIVESAITSSISEERICTQLQKLGNTPFISSQIDLELDSNIFISIKELNELRRKLVTKLEMIRKNKKKEVIKNKVSFPKIPQTLTSPLYTAVVTTNEQLVTCLKLNFDRIYVRDRALYEKYQENDRIYFYGTRNLLNQKKNNFQKLLVSEYSDFHFSKNIVGNYFLNITNSYTAYYLLRNGLHNFCLSVELEETEVSSLIEGFRKRFKFTLIPEILVYGQVENMMIKGNILNITNDLFRYQLRDQRKRMFDVYMDSGNTYILDETVERRIKILPFIYSKRFDFYSENSKKIIEIVKKYQ